MNIDTSFPSKENIDKFPDDCYAAICESERFIYIFIVIIIVFMNSPNIFKSEFGSIETLEKRSNLTKPIAEKMYCLGNIYL